MQQVQSEQDKMVPIDTSGDPVDIELKEDDKKENEVQVEQPTESVQTKGEEKKDEELEEYSQSVKRRIDKLTRKMREAERREQAAIDYAKKVQAENKNLQATTINTSRERVSSDEVKNLSYEDLSNEVWKERIVIRSSNNIYNQSLVASLISNLGIEQTEKWAKGLVSNFARKPQGNDRSQILAVANGEADIAIANSYYYGLMLSGSVGQDQQNAAKKVKMLFPNQNNRGTHVNISGAGILKFSKNQRNAEIFLEFLISPKVQKHIVNNTFEYPIIDEISPSPFISQFGISFVQDETPASDFGKFNSDSIKLMDRAGWK